jgi:Holliday junction DNA helicase RuvA
MISALKGKVFGLTPGEVHLETSNGVIYEILCPVSEYILMKQKQEVLLYTVLKMKDDKAVLFGFLEKKKKHLFEKMIGISGVGGRTALSFISAFSFEELSLAISQADMVKLSSIPGVGKKTAQLIILKLTGKLKIESDKEELGVSKLKEELISALENLGYPRKGLEKIVDESIADENMSFEEAFRAVMKKAQKGRK